MVDEVRKRVWAKKALNVAEEECDARIFHSCCRPLSVWCVSVGFPFLPDTQV